MASDLNLPASGGDDDSGISVDTGLAQFPGYQSVVESSCRVIYTLGDVRVGLC